jgi:hypothetical protein
VTVKKNPHQTGEWVCIVTRQSWIPLAFGKLASGYLHPWVNAVKSFRIYKNNRNENLLKYFENISALSVADMRMTLRSGRRGNKSFKMIMRKSDWRSRSWISSRIMCVVLLSSLNATTNKTSGVYRSRKQQWTHFWFLWRIKYINLISAK